MSLVLKRNLKTVVITLVILLANYLIFVFDWCDWTANDDFFGIPRCKIQSYMNDVDLPSISVAVAKDGKIIWEESFGWSDVEKQNAATPDTMYALASTSKALTATGVMILAERGHVDLDHPIVDYLGDLELKAQEGDLSDVTLRRIFAHTAGFPRYWNQYYEHELGLRPSTKELVRRYGVLVSPPGDRYIYSDVGIALAECLIERISGKSYSEFMQAEVFVPLGLSRTAIITSPYDQDHIAQKYAGGEKLPFYDMGFRAAGSAWASAHDLARYGMFHLKDHLADQQQIISDEAIDEMFQSSDSRLPEHNYHFPWIERKRGGYRIMEFGGHVIGAKCSLQLVPLADIAVVVLSNGDEADTQRICDWVLAELLPGYLRGRIWEEFVSGIGRIGSWKPSEYGDLVGEWVGGVKTYEGEIAVRLIIEKDGSVRIKLPEDGATVEWKEPQTDFPLWIEKESFFGAFPVEISTSDTSRYDHRTVLDVRLRQDRLSGMVYAESYEAAFGLPAYVELSRANTAQRQ